MKFIGLLAVSTALLLSSCVPQVYYQVYDVEAVGLQDNGNLLVYENEDCSISYSLWGVGGNLTFVFQNKLDENLYLIMPQCFLIHNGWALDYYDDNMYSYSSSNSTTGTLSAQATLYGLSRHYDHWHPAAISRGASIAATASNTLTVTYKAPLTICIPAHSSKVIDGFNLSKTVHLECDKTKNNFPKRQSQFIFYDEETTPLYVNNIIAYSTDPEGNSTKKIENKFWVKTFTNYSENYAFDTHVETDCTTGKRQTVKVFKMTQPNKFYNVYDKKTSRGTQYSKTKKAGKLFY